MKNYTPALVSTGKPKFSLKTLLFGNAVAKNNYYSARHKTDDIYLLWIESNRFGRVFSFPCVIEEQGDPMIYHTGRAHMSKNNLLIQRWNLFAIPATFEDDYTTAEHTAEEFYTQYNGYKGREAEKSIAAAEEKALEAGGEVPQTEEEEPEPEENQES